MNIEELAREAGFYKRPRFTKDKDGYLLAIAEAESVEEKLTRFAAAVRREALEEAAQKAESMGPIMCESYGDGAECIATADACATAIRSIQSPTTPEGTA